MRRLKKDQIEWLEFEQLQQFPDVIHGVFLRHGGVSEADFGSLNLGGGTGDSLDAIKTNRERVCSILGLDQLVSGKQVHGTGLESIPEPSYLIEEGCDGLLTNAGGLGLLIKHADCQAAIFFDPIKKVIANVHCGWRGNVQNIYAKTVHRLKEKYGSRPEDLFVCISPSLGPENSQFVNFKTEFPENFIPFQIRAEYFDLWEISKMQLKSAGVLEEHIEIAGICTLEEKNDFFSFRRDKKTGRNGTVVALKHP